MLQAGIFAAISRVIKILPHYLRPFLPLTGVQPFVRAKHGEDPQVGELPWLCTDPGPKVAFPSLFHRRLSVSRE
jgi:hypothetical protein